MLHGPMPMCNVKKPIPIASVGPKSSNISWPPPATTARRKAVADLSGDGVWKWRTWLPNGQEVLWPAPHAGDITQLRWVEIHSTRPSCSRKVGSVNWKKNLKQNSGNVKSGRYPLCQCRSALGAGCPRHALHSNLLRGVQTEIELQMYREVTTKGGIDTAPVYNAFLTYL